MKVKTIVRGKVPRERQKEFESAYASLRNSKLPAGLTESMLIKVRGKEDIYIIETIWKDYESLENMKKNTETPEAIRLFREFGIFSGLEICDIIENIP